MPGFVTDSKWFGWDVSETVLKQAKRRCLLLSAANAILSVLCGLIPTGLTRHNWVSFAVTLALLALMLEIIAAVRFTLAPSMLDRRSFDSIHQMMLWSSQCHMLLMGIALAAGIISCVQSFSGVRDLLVMAGFAVSAVLSLLFYRAYRSLHTCEMNRPE